MFLDDAVTYMLSRLWHDLFSAYIFRLHPVPHCSETVAFEVVGWVVKESEVQPACSAEAAAWVQAQYALGVLAVTSTLHAAAARSHMATRSPYIFEQCTAIAGMFVGWAAGDAVVRAFKDYVFAAEAVAPAMAPAPSQATEAMLLACGYTAVACVAIVLLQLTAHPLVACSNGAWVDAAEQASYSLWALATRGLTSSVAILWAYVCATILREGLGIAQPGTALESVESRLSVLWAVCVSLLSAAVASSLLRWREACTDAQPLRPSAPLARPDSTAPAPSAPPSPPAPMDAWDDPWDEAVHQGVDMEAIRAEALRSSQLSGAAALTFDRRWQEVEEGVASPPVRGVGMGAIGKGVVAEGLPGGGRWCAGGGTPEAADVHHSSNDARARAQTARRTETARAELALANTRAELALAKARMGSGTGRSQLVEPGTLSWNEGARIFASVPPRLEWRYRRASSSAPPSFIFRPAQQQEKEQRSREQQQDGSDGGWGGGGSGGSGGWGGGGSGVPASREHLLERPKSPSSLNVTSSLSYLSSNVGMLSLASLAAGPATSPIFALPKLVRRAWGSLDAGPHHVALEAGRQMLLLLERVLTWLGGCAWASVLLAPSASPSLALAVKDLAAASGLLILVVGALILLGGRTERVVVGARMELMVEIDRTQAESYFMAKAAAVFVGGAWVVVFQDLAAISDQLVISAPPSSVNAPGLSEHESTSKQTEISLEISMSAFLGTLGGVVLAGALTTLLVIWTKHQLLRAYTSLGRNPTRALLLDLLVRGADEEEGHEMHTRLGRRAKEGRERTRKEVERDEMSNPNLLL
eukprot:jgi/Chrpa1/11914/Chrysochromulina_OHIO_Genome00021225-RA